MENQVDSAVKTDEVTTVTTTEVNEDVNIAGVDGTEVDATFTDTDTNGNKPNEDSASKEGEKSKVQEGTDKPKQSKDKNKEFADKRRAEKLAKDEAELNIVKEYIGNNPFTKEPIETLRDLKVYKTMKKIEKDGGDPVQDYYKYAGKEEQTAIDNEKARQESVKKDVRDFMDAFPDVDLNELSKDENFVKFSNKLMGKVPLKDIYSAYEDVRGTLKTNAEELAKKELATKLAKENSSAGNLSASGDVGAPKYTMEQLGKMSSSDVNKDWKNVEASYDYWQKHKK